MALDERYFISAPLNQFFIDKDSGLPLQEGTLTFYRDSARTETKAVYQLAGTPANYSYTSLSNPVTLSSVGTVENAANDNVILYFYPYEGTPEQASGVLDLYYIVCKSKDGVTQWTREGWPNVSSANDPLQDKFPVQNQIANPQFSEIFINDSVSTTYTVSGVTTRFALAPNWDIELGGTGTAVVSRVAIAGSAGIATSPPYVLDVNVSAGITSCKIIQKLDKNSGLWASTSGKDIYISGTILGENQLSGNASIEMYYSEPSTGASTVFLSGSVGTGGYTLIKDASAIPIPASTSASTGDDGYIELYISLDASSHVRLSSIQAVPTVSNSGADIAQYDVRTSNREQALMGDYYIPNLIAKRVDSLLTGWDFAVNPAQFGESQTLGATSAYIWDQTIGERTAGNVAVVRNTTTGGMQFTNTAASEAFYVMQYLTGDEVKRILGNKLSVNMVAHKTSVGSDVTARVYLYRTIASYAESRVATTANLNATYVNGALGVGATLTNAGALIALSIDGVALSVNDLVVVKNQTSTFQNGWYTVTTVGSGAVAWVLTRATGYDEAAEMLQGAIFPIGQEGTTNGNLTFSQDNAVATVGTDPLAFTQTTSVPTITNSIGSVAAGGVFTLNTTSGQGLNWTEIPRAGLGTATSTLPVVNASTDLNNDNDISFSQWQLTDATQISNTDKFAIVVTFNVPTGSTIVTVDSISVNIGDIPSRPAVKTKDAVLRECRYYYEKSYAEDVAPGTITTTGERFFSCDAQRQTAGVAFLIIPNSFQVEYERKIHNPSMTFYNPTAATANRIFIGANIGSSYPLTTSVVAIAPEASPKYHIDSQSLDRAFMRCISVTTLLTPAASTGVNEDIVGRYHYVADARLGVI